MSSSSVKDIFVTKENRKLYLPDPDSSNDARSPMQPKENQLLQIMCLTTRKRTVQTVSGSSDKHPFVPKENYVTNAGTR